MKFNTKEYQEKLTKAEFICLFLKGKPKDHYEWCNRFNLVGKIARILFRTI